MERRWSDDFFQAEDGIRDVERSRGLGDVYKRQVHLFAIPNDYDSNGLLPSCKEKVDGNYQYKKRCDAFYKCENGTASAIKCPQNTIFDSVKRSCEVGIICSK